MDDKTAEKAGLEAQVSDKLEGIRIRMAALAPLRLDPADGSRTPSASVYEEADGLETLFHVPAYYPDAVQNAIAQAFMNAAEDRKVLFEAVRCVLALADAWEARGKHSIESAKSIPWDVADAIKDAGTDMVDSAEKIRTAVAQAWA